MHCALSSTPMWEPADGSHHSWTEIGMPFAKPCTRELRRGLGELVLRVRGDEHKCQEDATDVFVFFGRGGGKYLPHPSSHLRPTQLPLPFFFFFDFSSFVFLIFSLIFVIFCFSFSFFHFFDFFRFFIF